MGHQENRIADSPFSKWIESSAPPDDDLETVRLSAARTRAMDEAGAAIARQLNGPMTALLLYMGEIKQHSQQLSQAAGNRVYLQQVVENALQQTERVCAMIKQMADTHEEPAAESGRKTGWEKRAGRGKEGAGVMFASSAGQKPLTKREREVLSADQRGFLQQARCAADEHQSAHLREPPRRGDAKARRAKHGRPRPPGTAAPGRLGGIGSD